MPQVSNQTITIILIAFSIYILYLLAPILTPFLLGALLAYLANPLVKRLDKRHVPHLLSVILVFIFLFCIFLAFIFMLIPLIQQQIDALSNSVPQVADWLQEKVIPWMKEYVDVNALKSTLKSTLSANVYKSAWLFGTVIKSGYALISMIVNIVLTPVVTFYLLRDWDFILTKLSHSLPKSIKPTVLKLAKECDDVLSAFFRGQLLVMLALSLIYSIGLTLIGLKVGFIIGLIGGLLSIVPYLGSIFILVAASLAALVQFGTWQLLLWVVAVFVIGQILEGYVLVPYLVGERIGLHPVAVIFAVMAGGTLFGFFGVLVALPVAAVIVVLLRFVKKQYLVVNN
jgi:predicted PurR-regulated permease PerM